MQIAFVAVFSAILLFLSEMLFAAVTGHGLLSYPLGYLILALLFIFFSYLGEVIYCFSRRYHGGELAIVGMFNEIYATGGNYTLAFVRITYSVFRKRFQALGYAYHLTSENGEISVRPFAKWQSQRFHVVRKNDAVERVFYVYRGSIAREPQTTDGITEHDFHLNQVESGFFIDYATRRPVKINFRFYEAFRPFRDEGLEYILGQGWRKIWAVLRTLRRARHHYLSYEDHAAECAEALNGRQPPESFFIAPAALEAIHSHFGQVEAMTADSDDFVLSELQKLSDRSHAPYSEFPVAACVVDASGRRYFGVNVENAAFPSGTCAEEAAIARFIAEGGEGISQVFVYSPKASDVTPCGACRQRLWEFAGAHEATVVTFDAETGPIRRSMTELLPHRFNL